MVLRRNSPLAPRIAGVAAILAVVSLSGCSSSSSSAPTVQPSQSTAATAPVPVPPLAGGECSGLLTDVAVQSALGVQGQLQPGVVVTSTGPLAPFAVGGIRCAWYFGEQGDASRGNLDVTIIPSSLATASELADALAGSGCSDNGSATQCSISADASGWWIDGVIVVPADGAATAAARVADALKGAVATAAAPTIEAHSPVGCSELSAAISAISTVEPGAMTEGAAFNGPGKAAVAAAARESGETLCTWTSSAGFSFELTLSPHVAGSQLPCAVGGGTETAPTGTVTMTTFEPTADFGARVCATDGVSSVRLLAPSPSDSWTGAQAGEITDLAVAALAAVS